MVACDSSCKFVPAPLASGCAVDMLESIEFLSESLCYLIDFISLLDLSVFGLILMSKEISDQVT